MTFRMLKQNNTHHIYPQFSLGSEHFFLLGSLFLLSPNTFFFFSDVVWRQTGADRKKFLIISWRHTVDTQQILIPSYQAENDRRNVLEYGVARKILGRKRILLGSRNK
jgi:hypothetical protein